MSGRLLATCLLAALIISGCVKSKDPELDRINKALVIRQQALNNRDLSLYMTVISPGFKNGNKDYRQLQSELASGFKRYEQLSYRSDPVNVSISGDRAQVEAGYELRVKLAGKETVLHGVEHLTLVREAGEWKIIAGL